MYESFPELKYYVLREVFSDLCTEETSLTFLPFRICEKGGMEGSNKTSYRESLLNTSSKFRVASCHSFSSQGHCSLCHRSQFGNSWARAALEIILLLLRRLLCVGGGWAWSRPYFPSKHNHSSLWRCLKCFWGVRKTKATKKQRNFPQSSSLLQDTGKRGQLRLHSSGERESESWSKMKPLAGTRCSQSSSMTMWQWEASIHRRGHCPVVRRYGSQHLEAVAWHLVLRAVTSKREPELAVREGTSTDTTGIFGNLKKKKEEDTALVTKEETTQREQEDENSALFLWRVVENCEHLLLGRFISHSGYASIAHPGWCGLKKYLWPPYCLLPKRR